MAQVFCYELALPDVASMSPDDWEGVLTALRSSLRASQIRLLSYINPIDPDEFEMTRRKHMALQTTELGRAVVQQEARMINYALKQTPGWSMRHYLLVWGRPLRALSNWLTENAFPPEPLPRGVEYVESDNHLRPAVPGAPFVTAMCSYEFVKGAEWTWDKPWADLISRADGPMIVSLDAVRLPDEKVLIARKGLMDMQKFNPGDPDAALRAAKAIEAVQSGEEFYEMRLSILLSDTKRDRLEQRAEKIRNAHESAIRFTRMGGQQWDALQFFSSVERPKLGATSTASSHSFVLGTALPVAYGGLAGIVNRVEAKGVYMGFRTGINGQSLGPVHWSPFSSGNRAAHVGILGQIGGGKTVSMNALLARFRATENIPIVLLEPIGNASFLQDLLRNDPGMRFHRMDWTSLRLNPLDWIPETLDPEVGMSEQEAHAESVMEVMLSRGLNNIEKGFLARALKEIYRGYDPEMLEDPNQSPRLELLCDVLDGFRNDRFGSVAEGLAHELAGKFVQGGMGRIFNQPTNLPMKFDGADLFDVSAVVGTDSGNQAMQQIVYYSIFSHFLRVARRDKRDGKRVRRIFAVDEYFRMAESPYLKARLNTMVRTLRNLYTSIWLAEQTISTIASEASLISNIPFWLLFKLEPSEADLAPKVFGRRCPPMLADVLPTLTAGSSVGLLDQTMLLQVVLLKQEYESLVKPTRQP